jgi:hypothetical protein
MFFEQPKVTTFMRGLLFAIGSMIDFVLIIVFWGLHRFWGDFTDYIFGDCTGFGVISPIILLLN